MAHQGCNGMVLGRICAEWKLLQSAVEVTAVRVPATHHDFALLNALADTPATKATVQLASQKLAEALSLAAPSRASA